jgi:hypothetical protein
MTPDLPQLDHLVLACPDLAAGVREVETLLGVRLVPGGSHPAWGTRNAVLPLGPSTYLEVIGPDPARSTGTVPRLFGIDRLETPSLVTWAAKSTDLPGLAGRAQSHGIDLGAVEDGRRVRSDGTTLSWRLTDPFKPRAGGVLPFFIDWTAGDHPSTVAQAEVGLVDLAARHPDPDRVAADLRVLGLHLSVQFGPEPALIARLRTPVGVVLLQ